MNSWWFLCLSLFIGVFEEDDSQINGKIWGVEAKSCPTLAAWIDPPQWARITKLRRYYNSTGGIPIPYLLDWLSIALRGGKPR